MQLKLSVEGISRKDFTSEYWWNSFHDIMCHVGALTSVTGMRAHIRVFYVSYINVEITQYCFCWPVLVDLMPKETTMDNVNILLWITASRTCFISKAGIVQQNDWRWFHTESGSSMRFLVPRSRPLQWVIMKVQASMQDNPMWVTLQRLHTAFPRLSTVSTALPPVDIMFVSKHLNGGGITFHSPVCI